MAAIDEVSGKGVIDRECCHICRAHYDAIAAALDGLDAQYPIDGIPADADAKGWLDGRRSTLTKVRRALLGEVPTEERPRKACGLCCGQGHVLKYPINGTRVPCRDCGGSGLAAVPTEAKENDDMSAPIAVRKKPVVVEAMQWVGSATAATPIIDWVLYGCGTARYHEEECMCSSCPDGEHIVIDTLEGSMVASPGDWIIRGVVGEFYPCKPDIFEQTYERAAPSGEQ